jgi:hypothetical protein|tara:strand:- start:55 stop:756 length:702 start_codon:yes stop_codon:yes gene_type:complete
MATLKNRIYNPTSFAPPRTAAAKKTAENFSVKNVNQKAGRTRKEMQTNNTKQMSAGMAAWVKANRKRLTSGKHGNTATDKQKALFKQYDALKKEGRLPNTSATKSRPSPKAQPSAKAKPTKPSPVQPAQSSNTTKTKKKKTGVHGKFLDSNPPLKSQPKKSKLNPQQRRKAGKINRRRGVSPGDIAKSISKKAKSFSDKLRLTYKKGQIVQRGGKFYKSDGKGGFTLVHRRQF